MLQADRHNRGAEGTPEFWARHTVLLGQLICHTEDEAMKGGRRTGRFDMFDMDGDVR